MVNNQWIDLPNHFLTDLMAAVIHLFIYLYSLEYIHFQNSGTHPKGGASNTKQQSYKVIERLHKIEELGARINESMSLQYMISHYRPKSDNVITYNVGL